MNKTDGHRGNGWDEEKREKGSYSNHKTNPNPHLLCRCLSLPVAFLLILYSSSPVAADCTQPAGSSREPLLSRCRFTQIYPGPTFSQTAERKKRWPPVLIGGWRWCLSAVAMRKELGKEDKEERGRGDGV
ncbi:uncharacterized protein LOC126625604 [Malus sylvestris]|uniref:uncharacterized protein LOC126625604 n=1 Tax=Malus sylvestris TaxID=3752 RepID=UPI0021ACA520|nr:uncharacterized protein LOC126625604 [Malus sylvestris]